MTRSIWLAGALVAALCAGCHPTPATQDGGTDAGQDAGAGVDGGQDAGSGCVASHLEDGGCVAAVGGWVEASSLQHARDHHVTFVGTSPAGSFLYVAGGTNYTTDFSNVEAAPIDPYGDLGTFTDVGSLPQAAIGSGLAQIGPRDVVIAGGLVNGDSVADSAWGHIQDDGTITFTAGPAMNQSRYHVSLSLHGGYVYAIGGLYQHTSTGTPVQNLVDTIERAPVQSGALGAFEQLDPLPAPETHQAAVVVGDRLYLVGGVVGSTASAKILSATFGSDGTLSTFSEVGTLPAPRATSAAFELLGRLFVIAGGSTVSGGETNTTLVAPLDSSGHVGTFTEEAALPTKRQHVHQAPVFNGHVYSAGGSNSSHFCQAQVYIGILQ